MKFEHLPFHIELGLENLRLDRALALHPQVRTRSRAAKLIEQGLVSLVGQKAKASQITQLGQTYDLQIPQEQASTLTPLDLHLDIVFEDHDILVVNKPAGLVVHPAAGHAQDTLVNALIHHTPHLSMGFNEQRPGIVHRLDKDTSGLLVVAKNDQAHEILSHQFRAREVHRIYWAIVFGRPKKEEGRLESNLTRHPNDRKRFASAHPDLGVGKHAITNYKLLQTSNNGLSLIQLKLETGRTHQIRVHLSELGYSIVGDVVYSGTRRTASLSSIPLRKLIDNLGRFALHAAELGFRHPRTNETLFFRAPVPSDLQSLVSFCEFQL